jgi:hypothetical protein
MRFRLLGAILLLGGCSIVLAPPAPEPSTVVLEIWEVAILEYFGHGVPFEPPPLSPLVRELGEMDSVSESATTAWLAEQRIPAEVYWNWTRANRSPMQLRRAPRIPGIDLRLLSPGAVTAPGQHVLQLTYPGLNVAGDTAIVTFGHHCGPLCGHGVFLVLARDKMSKWVVIHRWDSFS